MPKQVTKQASIVFEPIAIQSKFQKQFNIQLAFYRNDKVKKIEPIKLSQPQKIISFNAKQSAMKLHTTLIFYEDEDKIQNKIFKLQTVYKIDGNKDSCEKDIDPSFYYKRSKETFSFKITNKPETQLKFRVHIFFKDQKEKQPINQPVNKEKLQSPEHKRNQVKSRNPNQNATKSTPKPILMQSKSLKLIKFDEASPKQQEQNQTDFKELQKKKKNTVKISQEIKSNNQSQRRVQKDLNAQQATNNLNKKYEQKISFLEKQVHQKSKQLNKAGIKYTQIEQKYKQLGTKYQKLSQKYNEIQNEKSKQQSTFNQTNQQDLKKQKQKYQKLEKQSKRLKQHNSQLQKKLQQKQVQNKKLASEIKNLNDQVKKHESRIKQLKEESKQFEELLLEMENKNQKTSLDQTLKPYKERIKILQRQLEDLTQEKNFAEKQVQGKSDEIFQLRQKIKNLNEENLKSCEQLSTKQYEIEKLEKKVKDLQVSLKNAEENRKKDLNMSGDEDDDQDESSNYNKFKSQKVIGGGSSNSITKLKAQNNQLKTKLQIALKNLQNKQNLLKRFDSFSSQGKKQLQQQLDQLKKQNSQLKSKLSGLQSGGGSKNTELMGLQSRMQLEKVKKELQYKTKSERQLLIDKSQLQARNKTLQEDVVKSKQSIANILNAIHQFGDEGLIEDVNTFLC